jgi:hypothetical protein
MPVEVNIAKTGSYEGAVAMIQKQDGRKVRNIARL